MYCTNKIVVKESHPLHSYLENLTKDTKYLYNATQFHYRQIYTGLTTEKNPSPVAKRRVGFG